MAAVESERRELLDQQALDIHDFEVHCASHGLSPSANRPTIIRDYDNKAAALRAAVWSGAILASAVFALLNILSLAFSQAITAIGSVAFAVLIGYVAHCLIAFLVPVDILEPRSVKGARRVLIVGGLTALASFCLFLYGRFSESEVARAGLPAIAMTFEAATLAFVAAAWEILPLYEWQRKLTEDFDKANRTIRILDEILFACKTQLTKEEVRYENDLVTDSRGSSSEFDDPKPEFPKPNGSAGNHSGLR
jgi:hypothetical protein